VRSLQAPPSCAFTASTRVQPSASFGSVAVIKKEIANVLSNPVLPSDAKTNQINFCLRDVFISLLPARRASQPAAHVNFSPPSLAPIEAILLAYASTPFPHLHTLLTHPHLSATTRPPRWRQS
jgi:hypothetical protein